MNFIRNVFNFSVLSLLVISFPIKAYTVCTYEGNLQYVYAVSGTSDHVVLTPSGPYDRSSSLDSGYVWYYPKMLKKYTQNNGTYTLSVRDGVDFIFTPTKGSWENKAMDDWNRFRSSSSHSCNTITWGASDWKQIFANAKVAISSDSLIGGNIVFINEPIAKIYASIESVNSPPIMFPAKPTSTIYLNGQVTAVSSCSVSPSSLDIDFGEIPSSLNEKIIHKIININCKKKVSGNIYIGGEKVSVGNIIDIDTSDRSVTFFIKVNRNDFEIESASGVIGVDAGIRLSPSATPGLYKGVTYIDLRYN
ncbi:hypothetical protein ABO03_003375 [Salmonella enterica subsp. enterica serovar Glostrup]|nr:hypothetical protein [Salmonella enterica]EHA9227490.1 hypothetical protein [Salmonella enterica subsp. enterica serovar Glostrup]EJR4301111.1 hypothetical protein [Salmonella enterica]